MNPRRGGCVRNAAVFDRVLAAIRPEFGEPTPGALQGNDFYCVANSHWNRFDPEYRPPDGLSRPIVLGLPLGGGGALDMRNQNEYSD